jgi:hypothetical protein
MAAKCFLLKFESSLAQHPGLELFLYITCPSI